MPMDGVESRLKYLRQEYNKRPAPTIAECKKWADDLQHHASLFGMPDYYQSGAWMKYLLTILENVEKSTQLALHLGDGGDLPGVCRTLRNALDELSSTPKEKGV